MHETQLEQAAVVLLDTMRAEKRRQRPSAFVTV
jgi:hypothetical protein